MLFRPNASEIEIFGSKNVDAPIFDFCDSDLTVYKLIHIGDHNRALYIKKCK